MARTKYFLIYIAFSMIACVEKSENEDLQIGGELFGIQPSAIPQMILPGIISTDGDELNGVFTPDGNEFFYSLEAPNGNFSTILTMKRNPQGIWSHPEIASFSGTHSDVDPMISPDGMRLYFCSNRPTQKTRRYPDFDFWMVEKQSNGWGSPNNLGTAINTGNNDFYCSEAKSGNIYFSTWDSDRRTDDIFVARPTTDGFQIENLGDSINTFRTEYDPFISPDESYIIFSSYQRDNYGDSDLYISFQKDGEWTGPRNLGARINTSAKEYCPFVTTDGENFIFTSKKMSPSYQERSFNRIDSLRSYFNKIENGQGNIYIMKADFIKEMKDET